MTFPLQLIANARSAPEGGKGSDGDFLPSFADDLAAIASAATAALHALAALSDAATSKALEGDDDEEGGGSDVGPDGRRRKPPPPMPKVSEALMAAFSEVQLAGLWGLFR